jgi:hypothetical protein
LEKEGDRCVVVLFKNKTSKKITTAAAAAAAEAHKYAIIRYNPACALTLSGGWKRGGRKD